MCADYVKYVESIDTLDSRDPRFPQFLHRVLLPPVTQATIVTEFSGGPSARRFSFVFRARAV